MRTSLRAGTGRRSLGLLFWERALLMFSESNVSCTLRHLLLSFILQYSSFFLAPHSSTDFVFTDFEDQGGWKNDGVSLSIGLLISAWSFVGDFTESVAFCAPN